MKDSRVTVWTNPTSNLTGSTTNTGPTIDLFASGAMQGGTSDGTGLFGIGAEIIQTFVSGTQSTAWEWRVSSDAFAADDQAGGFIGTVALTAAGSSKLKTSIETRRRYARLKATNTGTGASTSNAYAEDMGSLTGTIAASNG